MTLAALAWDQGASETAHRHLEAAIGFTASESAHFPFVDNPDAAVRSMLAAHTSRTAYPEFLRGCRIRCEAVFSDGPSHRDPPTRREREVLAYLRTPMTADEIADKMCVSVNTLKTHQRSIYRKLRVANRREAIRQA